MVSTPRLSAILSGPTASGKTEIALEFARRQRERGTPLHIINADSLLVYRQMNIGTAKPSDHELRDTPHHLIDVCDPNEVFTAGDFSKRVSKTLGDLESRGIRALIVGGSGFYLKALLYGLWEGAPSNPALRTEIEKIPNVDLYNALYELDRESALRIGGNDRYRLVRAHELLRLVGKTPTELKAEQNTVPDPRLRLLVVDRANEELHTRIHARSAEMLRLGLVGEVTELRKAYPGSRALSAVGYEQVCQYLDGKLPPGRKSKPGEDGLLEEIELATRQLVKRQRTWFKGEHSAIRFELERDRESLFRKLEEIYA
jgi:tRNA dimethylallyltransferase